MNGDQYAEFTKNIGHLPVMSPNYVFGKTIPRPQTDPSGNIVIDQKMSYATATPSARDQVINFWISKGAPRHVAEGIADRTNIESGFNPSALGDGGTSVGLYQHHAERKDRLEQLPNWQTIPVQNEFAYSEVTGGDPQSAAHWKEILASPDRKTAEQLWTKYFERPASVGGWHNDPIISAGNWNVSPKAIATAMDEPDTSVRYMSPDAYLALSPPVDEGADRKRQSLSKSLEKGEQVENLPALDVRAQGNTLTVYDQDGRNRALEAKKAGVDLIPVAIHGIPRSNQDYTKITGMTGKDIPFTFAQVQARPHEPPKAPSTLQSFGMGVADVGVGAGQLAAHLGAATPTAGMPEAGIYTPEATQPLVSTADVDKAVADREAAYERGRTAGGQTGTDWARLAGNVVGTAPLAFAVPGGVPANALARVGQAVAMGGVGGALAPVTSGDYGSGLASNVGTGALTGVALGAGGNALARVASPYIQPAAQRLQDLGVRLTSGMRQGGYLKGVEDRFTSIVPTLPGAYKRAIQDFNKAAYNKVLGRIGLKYEGNEVGYDGVKAVGDELSKEYKEVLKDIRFDRRANNGKFDVDLENLRDLAKEMPSSEREQFEAILNNRVLKRMGPEGTMDGETFKGVESELSTISRRLHRHEMQGQRDLADAVDTLNGMLRENIEDQNPAKAAELRAANAAWAAFVRIQKAAANRPKSLGEFTPTDLLTASKRAAGEKVFARGDALLQDLAADAERVIPNKYPESGTTGRMLAAAAAGGLGHFLHPGFLVPYVGGALAYSQPGQAGINLLRNFGGPAVRNMLARGAQQIPLRIAPAGGAVMSQPSAQPLPYP